MGLLSRFRKMVTANIGSMGDKTPDPERQLQDLIREIEKTAVELKASCAQAIAEKRKAERRQAENRSTELFWEQKARLAVEKGRDDLAREALLEKRRASFSNAALAQTLAQHLEIVNNYQEHIAKLEEKLKTAREQQQLLAQRRIHATHIHQSCEEIDRFAEAPALLKLNEMERRIELEANPELLNLAEKSQLEAEIEKLERDQAIEQELQSLKLQAFPPKPIRV